jgi:hypothetical protein
VEEIAREFVPIGGQDCECRKDQLCGWCQKLADAIAAAIRTEREARKQAESAMVLAVKRADNAEDGLIATRAERDRAREALTLQMSSHDQGHSPCYCIESRAALKDQDKPKEMPDARFPYR